MKRIRVLHIDDKKGWAGGQSQLFLLYTRQKQGSDITPFLAVRKDTPLYGRLKDSDGIFTFNLNNEFDPFAVYGLYSIIKKTNPDILQCHTPHSMYPAYLAAKMSRKKPKIIVVRRVDNPIRSIYKYNITADCIVAVSENVAKMMAKSGYKKENIRIIRDAVDKGYILREAQLQSEYFEIHRKNDNTINIGSLSSLIRHKGIDILIKAFSRLVKEEKETQLIIAGEGDQHGMLLQMAKDLNIAEYVKFIGFTDKPYGFLSFLDMIIFPSRTEGLCSTILDSHVLKKNIIASDSGGIPEIIRHEENGILFNSGDADDLYFKMRDMTAGIRKNLHGDHKKNIILPEWADINNNLNLYNSLYKRMLKID